MISLRRRIVAFIVTAIVLIGLFVFAAGTGTLHITPAQLFRGLFIEFNPDVATIYDLRLPRIVIAIVGGAALAVSGVLLQAAIRNPLADPGIIGVSSGAGLAAVLVSSFAPSLFYFKPVFAFAGGLVAFFLVYTLSWQGGALSPLRIILIGIAMGSFFAGIASVFGASTGQEASGVASIVNTAITLKTWDDVRQLLVYALPALPVAWLMARHCNLLALEDKTARALGVEVTLWRVLISGVAVLLASITCAVIGPISFLGLIVPHAARLIVGSTHGWLIPYSALLGACSLLVADTIGRTIVAPYEISAGVVMAVVGGPAFIYLLRRSFDAARA